MATAALAPASSATSLKWKGRKQREDVLRRGEGLALVGLKLPETVTLTQTATFFKSQFSGLDSKMLSLERDLRLHTLSEKSF